MTSIADKDKASIVKLLVYLLLMAFVVFINARLHKAASPPRAQVLAADGATPAMNYKVLHVGSAVEEVREQLPLMGIPQFLRNAKVTGEIERQEPLTVSFALRKNGVLIGRYFEKLLRIDDDRTKIVIGFQPINMAKIVAIAAPIETEWTAPELFLVVAREHLRSRFADEDFDVGVLKKTSSTADTIIAALRGHDSNSDDFPLEHRDEEDANIRKAYRDEAAKAGAEADNL